jgi:hypothetical protein
MKILMCCKWARAKRQKPATANVDDISCFDMNVPLIYYYYICIHVTKGYSCLYTGCMLEMFTGLICNVGINILFESLDTCWMYHQNI